VIAALFATQRSAKAFVPGQFARRGRVTALTVAAAPPHAGASPVLASLSLPALKARCLALGLAVAGQKSDLIARLKASGKVVSRGMIAFENRLMVSPGALAHAACSEASQRPCTSTTQHSTTSLSLI